MLEEVTASPRRDTVRICARLVMGPSYSGAATPIKSPVSDGRQACLCFCRESAVKLVSLIRDDGGLNRSASPELRQSDFGQTVSLPTYWGHGVASDAV